MAARKPHSRKPARSRALSKRVEPDYVIPVDIYDLSICVFYALERMREWGKQQGLNWRVMDDCEALAFRGVDSNDVVCFSVYIPKNARVDILAHECVHLANMILETCDVAVNTVNDEAQAYLVQYLVRAIMAAR